MNYQLNVEIDFPSGSGMKGKRFFEASSEKDAGAKAREIIEKIMGDIMSGIDIVGEGGREYVAKLKIRFEVVQVH